jgi:hypothetical protein
MAEFDVTTSIQPRSCHRLVSWLKAAPSVTPYDFLKAGQNSFTVPNNPHHRSLLSPFCITIILSPLFIQKR